MTDQVLISRELLRKLLALASAWAREYAKQRLQGTYSEVHRRILDEANLLVYPEVFGQSQLSHPEQTPTNPQDVLILSRRANGDFERHCPTMYPLESVTAWPSPGAPVETTSLRSFRDSLPSSRPEDDALELTPSLPAPVAREATGTLLCGVTHRPIPPDPFFALTDAASYPEVVETSILASDTATTKSGHSGPTRAVDTAQPSTIIE